MGDVVLRLAALALISQPGAPAVLPVDLPLLFSTPFDASVLGAEPIAITESDDWLQFRVQQSWFGTGPWRSDYLIQAPHRLQRINVYPDACNGIEAELVRYLGEPQNRGVSPQVMHSLRYARWQREGLIFVLEWFVPGCELSIYREV